MTTLLRIGGSIIGGLIGRLFSKPEPGATFHPAGLIPVTKTKPNRPAKLS